MSLTCKYLQKAMFVGLTLLSISCAQRGEVRLVNEGNSMVRCAIVMGEPTDAQLARGTKREAHREEFETNQSFFRVMEQTGNYNISCEKLEADSNEIRVIVSIDEKEKDSATTSDGFGKIEATYTAVAAQRNNQAPPETQQ